jgi:hypothetical protein
MWTELTDFHSEVSCLDFRPDLNPILFGKLGTPDANCIR